MMFRTTAASRSAAIPAAVLALALATTACGLGRAPQPSGSGDGNSQGQQIETRTVKLRLYFPGTFRGQAVLPTHTKLDVDHVVVKVSKVNTPDPATESRQWGDEPVLDESNRPLEATLSRDNLDGTLSFSGLRAKVVFRFRCYAYRAPGENPADLISTPDSFIDFGFGFLGNSVDPPFPNLPVILKPTTFEGESRDRLIEIEAGSRITYDPPDIYVPEPVQTDPPGTVIIPPLTEELPDEAWEWGEEYGDE